jgi:DNA-binding transcriptional regulator YiaG
MYPCLTPVSVAAKYLLRSKQYTRWGDERARLRVSIGEEIERLRKLRFEVRRYPGWDVATQRWNARGASIAGDRLFEVVREPSAADSESSGRRAEPAWLIRPGHWAQWWLNAQGKVWTSAMPEALLGFGHCRNRGIDVLAKKIGFNMSVLWGALRARHRFDRRIDHLLEDVGEIPAPAERDCHWAGRLRDRFEEAMLRLQENGVFAEVAWTGGRGPGDLDRNKGWVDRWLASAVQIRRPGYRPPETAGPSTKSVAHKRARKKPAADPPGLTGSAIRMLRTNKEMSQLSFAGELGISTSYLSQIETGKRTANAKLLLRLQPWITTSEYR